MAKKAIAKILPNDLAEVEEALKNKHKSISERTTPKAYVKRRPDGFDYLEEGYMRNEGLNKNFPVWSWSSGGDNPVQFLGSEWVIVCGVLEIIDEGVPRKFFSPGAARVQFKRGSTHTPENVVDIDKNVASANTNAFKRAINRLTNFGDDIYRKQVEDLELTDGNIEVLNNLINRLDDIDIADKIMNAINNGEIHRSNIDKTVQYLRKQIENKEKKDG